MTIETLDLQNKALVTERDGLRTRAETAEARTVELEQELVATKDALIDLEIESLVGVRILPCEKDAFVRMRKLDKGLYDEMLATKPKDLGLLGKGITEHSPIQPPSYFGAIETDAFALAAKAK